MDMLKINVDASVPPGMQAYSVGMVVRDSNGQFVRARNSKYAGEVQVKCHRLSLRSGVCLKL